MINKKTYSINEDHKVLHKVGKRWVTVSTLLLGLIGGATMVAHGASADTTTPTNTNTVKANLNHQLAKQSQSNTSANVTVATKPSNSASSITNQAKQMHRSLMLDSPRPTKTTPSSASASAEPSSNSNNNQTKSSSNDNDMNTFQLGTRSQQARGWNFVQNSVRNHDYDNYKPKTRPKMNLGGANPASNPSQRHGLTYRPLLKDDDNDYFSGDVTQSGTYDGLNYNIYSDGAVEFTGGTADKRLNDFISDSPSDIKNSKYIKFDNNINTNNVTNMNDMFRSDFNLQSLNLGNNFDTSNVTTMKFMFHSDLSLHSLSLPNSFDTSNVTNMHGMFQSSSDLNSLTLPSSFNIKNGTNITHMLLNDTNLRTLVIQSPNTKFNSSINLPTKLYKETGQNDPNGKPYTSTVPNQFNGVGTYTSNLNPYVPIQKNASDGHWIYYRGGYISDNEVPDWTTDDNGDNWFGMNYHYSPSTKAVEFTGGKVSNIIGDYGGIQDNTQNIMSDFMTAWNGNENIPVPSDVKNATSIKFGNVDTNNNHSMQHMFANDSDLVSVDFGDNFNTNSTSNMSDMFSNDSNLKFVRFGKKFSTSATANDNNNEPNRMTNMFNGDDNLQSVIITSSDTQLYDNINAVPFNRLTGRFDINGNPYSEPITITSSMPGTYARQYNNQYNKEPITATPQKKASDGHWIYYNGGYLASGEVHDWTNGYNDDMEYLYSPSTQAVEYIHGNAQSLQNLTNISSPVQSIKLNGNIHLMNVGSDSSNNPFASDNLHSIDIGKGFGILGVNTGGFANIPNIRNINFNGNNLDAGSDLFANDDKLRSIIIPSDSGIRPTSHMFKGDTALHHVTFSSGDTTKSDISTYYHGYKNSDGISDYPDDIHTFSDAPNLEVITIDSPNVKFTSDSGVPKKMYRVIDSDATDNKGNPYTSQKPPFTADTPSSDWYKGNGDWETKNNINTPGIVYGNIGTWSTIRNPADVVVYYVGNNSNNPSSYVGYQGFKPTSANSDNITVDESNARVPNYHLTVASNTINFDCKKHYIQVAPNQETNTVVYTNDLPGAKNYTKTATITGTYDTSAQSAIENATPNDCSIKDSAPFDNEFANDNLNKTIIGTKGTKFIVAVNKIHITPATENIEFVNVDGSKQVGKVQQISGVLNRLHGIPSTDVPVHYHLINNKANNYDEVLVNNNSTDKGKFPAFQVAPNQESDTVNYTYDNDKVGSDITKVPYGSKVISDKSDIINGVPHGYKMTGNLTGDFTTSDINVPVVPQTINDNINFYIYRDNGNDEPSKITVGSSNVSGLVGSNVNLHAPSGYQLADPTKSSISLSPSASIYVVPTSASATYDYVLPNGKSISGHKENGNWYTDVSAGSTSDDITPSNANKLFSLSSNYQLASSNNHVPFNDSNTSVNIHAKSASETVDYDYNNSAVSSSIFNGNSASASLAGNNSAVLTDKSGLPAYYHLSNNASSVDVPFNNGSMSVAVVPDMAIDTIDYMFNGRQIGSSKVSGNTVSAKGATNTSATVTAPSGYHVASNANVLFDGGTHQVNVVPDNMTETIIYMNGNDKVGSVKVPGSFNAPAQSAVDNNTPQGYKIVGNSDVFNYPAFSSSKTIHVAPIVKSENVTYMNGNTRVSSDNVTGNETSSFDVDSKMPSGYKRANGQPSTIAYNGQNQMVQVVPVQKTDTINYQYNSQTKGSQQFTGNANSSIIVDPTNAIVPTGYHLSNTTGIRFSYDGGTYPVLIEPNTDTDTVDYVYNGQTLGNHDFSGNAVGNNTFDVNAKNEPGIPTGYHLINNDNKFNYDNHTHTVQIAPSQVSDNVVLTYNKNKLNNPIKISGTYGQPVSKSDMAKINHSIPNGYQLANNNGLTYGNVSDVAIQAVPKVTDDVAFIEKKAPDEYITVGQMMCYGNDGSTVELQASDVPNGYELVDKNGNPTQFNNAPRSFTLGQPSGPYTSTANTHTFVVAKNSNDNIPAVPNTVNVKGTVTLHFVDNGKTKDIKLDYLTQDSDAKPIDVLDDVDYSNSTGNTKPNYFLGQIIQGFDTTNFNYSGSSDAGNYTPSQSDTQYNHGSTKLLVHNVTLNFTNKPNTDPIAKRGSNDDVVYIDNGKTISSDLINGSTGSKFNTSSDVPSGYKLAPNAPTQLVHNGTTHTVNVIGTPITKDNDTKINVKVIEKPNGKTTSSQVSLVGKNVGDIVTVYPNEYTPQGYKMTNSDVPVTATIISNGKGGYNLQYNKSGIVNNTIPFNYNYDSANATNPMTINYVNQSGKTVGTKTYKVPSGTVVHPSSDIPSGYVDNGSPNSDKATDNPQPNIPFHVKGIPASQLSKYTNKGMVNLHIVEQNNGHALKSYNIIVDESQKDIGSDFVINANDKGIQPKGFVPDSADKTITGLVTDNGAVTDSGTDTFVYNASMNPIHVTFTNMLGALIPSADVNGGSGTPLTNSDIPHGYHLPSDAHYHFNSDNQLVDAHGNVVPSNQVQLEGNDIQGKANIVLEYQVYDPTGNNVVKTIYNKADDAQVILNGQVGGSQTINPWRYWKRDFTLPQSVQGQSATINFTPSDDNANDEHGQQFNPTLVFTSKARQAGDVVVRYVDTDTGKPIMINGKPDTQDIKNDTGDLIGQEIELGQSGANKDVAIDNDSNVRYVLNVPDGYHLEYNSNPITLQEAISNPSANLTSSRPPLRALALYSMSYHRPVGMVLTVGLSRPSAKKPATSGTSTDSGSIINPSGSASASGSATMPNIPVVPPTNTTNNYNYSDNGNSTNTTNNYYGNGGSKSTNTNSGSSVIPSDTAVNKAKNTAPNAPVNHASDNKAIPSDSTVTTNTKGAYATNGKATKHTTNRANHKPSKSKNSQSGIVSGKNINRPSKAQNRPNKTRVNKHVRHNHVDRNNENKTAEPSVAKATATGASANVANDNYDDYTNTTASPVTPNVSAPRVNVATNTTNNHGKLPQTGDSNKIAGMASVIMLLASISLAGADLDRKHRLN